MTAPPPAPPTDDRGRSRPEAVFGGWVLIVLGSLMVLLCGGCTLVMWGVGIAALGENASANTWGALLGLFFTTLLIGGLPTAGGAVLVWAGWRTLHPIRTPRAVAKTFE